MRYKKLEYKIKKNLYEFECYNINNIENDFGLNTEKYLNVYNDNEEPEIYGIGANPAGAGMSGG